MPSTSTSRCSSPIPEMIVCAVSASECTRNVGSSSESFCSAMESLSWSALVLGSMATEITGSGNFMASRMMGWPSSHSVSPVFVSFKPMAAAMSPPRTSWISSRLFACISRNRPMRRPVQQRLDALVLEGGAGKHQDDLPGNRRLAQHRADLVFGELVLFQVLVQDGVVL